MTSDNSQPNKEKNSFLEIVRFALITLIIVIPIRAYVAQPFIVSGTSMVPTFMGGEYLIIDQLSYHFQSPQRGEVVVFRFPQNPSKFFIKRIIGLPGDSVTISGNEISIITPDGELIILDESYVDRERPYTNIRVDLNEKEYFVLGDNRDVSSDSRVWGPVEDRLIKGRVLLRLFPFYEIGLWPGDLKEIHNI